MTAPTPAPNADESTPTTVYGVSPSSTTRPTTPGSLPNLAVQSP
jgi:hypothetical protein